MPALKSKAYCFTLQVYSSIAQSVEHAAVNRRVVGSSPTWGATLDKSEPIRGFGFVRILSESSCVWTCCKILSFAPTLRCGYYYLIRLVVANLILLVSIMSAYRIF